VEQDIYRLLFDVASRAPSFVMKGEVYDESLIVENLERGRIVG
jgi:hypothetical protein